MMNADRLLELLGRHADDPIVEQAIRELNSRRRPRLDPRDRDAVRDWVLIRKKGVELGFVDEVFFQAGEAWRRRRLGTPLLVDQVYFYTRRDDVQDFAGALPFRLEWSDDKATARHKLEAFEATRRSYQTDTWDATEFKLTLDYREGGSSIDSVLCRLETRPWPEKGRVQPTLQIEEWLPLFGLPPTSSELRRRLEPLDLQDRVQRSEDAREVFFVEECGLQLYFTEASNLKGVKRDVPRARTDLVFGAVQFFRQRELDARQWTGQLPLGLSFADSQQEMLHKIGRPPDRQNDSRFSGIAQWELPEHGLEIVYNNIDNHLLRVRLTAPGFLSA